MLERMKFVKTILLHFYIEPVNQMSCYALPAFLTVDGVIRMLCALCNDEYFSGGGYFDNTRMILKDMQTGQILDNNKDLEEQGIKEGMKLELLWKKNE